MELRASLGHALWPPAGLDQVDIILRYARSNDPTPDAVAVRLTTRFRSSRTHRRCRPPDSLVGASVVAGPTLAVSAAR
jgi:hypothetical protein